MSSTTPAFSIRRSWKKGGGVGDPDLFDQEYKNTGSTFGFWILGQEFWGVSYKLDLIVLELPYL